MGLSIKHYALTISLVISFLCAGQSFAGKPQGDPKVTGPFETEMREIFLNKDFQKLEKIANELRTTKARFPEGVYKLVYFYSGISTPTVESDETYKDHLKIIDEWMETYPDSITARVTKGQTYINYGWHARGSGYANTVTKLGWTLLEERLNKAYELLNKPPDNEAKDCPKRYECLLIIGNAQSWSKKELEKLFRQAIAFDPGYYGFYLQMTNTLLPKWGGSEGEWQKFIDDAISLSPESEGMTLYARLYWFTYWNKEWKSFYEPGISWEKMKQGFLDIEKNYPDSEWNLNMFAKFAFLKGDTETLGRLIKKIGDKPRMDIWVSKGNYDIAKKNAKIIRKN